MIFNTSWFLVFFPVVYVLFLLLPGARLRFAFLLLASAVFHWHYAGPAGVAPIIGIAICTFVVGLALARAPLGSRRRRLLLAAGLAVPVAALVGYKYRVLLLGTVGLGSRIPAQAGPGLGAAGVALPLAISFFTFEFVHYLTDVCEGLRADPEPVPLRVLLDLLPVDRVGADQALPALPGAGAAGVGPPPRVVSRSREPLRCSSASSRSS